MNVTINQLVDFVMLNRKNKAFKDCSPIQIAEGIVRAVEDSTLLYATNDKQEVVGLVVGRTFANEKVWYVWNMICIEKWVMKKFIETFQLRWPGYKLEAERRGKRVQYDTPKLINKITHN